ncbi:MAG: hypothetical protein NC347_10745 [Clostridium sp.]|nr:hypothetical protein [Clostridium sp.]
MYENIFYAGLLLFIAGLIVTVILFIRNHVAGIISDLTGFRVKRTMKNRQREISFDWNRNEAVPETANLFGVEEDITVLGGEPVSEMPATVILGSERRL